MVPSGRIGTIRSRTSLKGYNNVEVCDRFP